MFEDDEFRRIKEAKRQWEEGTLRETLKRFGLKESPNRFYTPLDLREYHFLQKVGFPGEYPFTAGTYAIAPPRRADGDELGLVRAGAYSGYGTAEDTRDYYLYMASRGRRGGPNIAFDLPTQCGHDSDGPMSCGEVGRVGVAIDTLEDFGTVYQAFTGDNDLDRIASNWTINAPTNIILAMYIALAQKRNIPQDKLRGTPQNDILKEFIARGTYIFPPKQSMRMTRDTITYCTKYMPLMNAISICMYHIREAGATAAQALGFAFSNAIAYIQLGVDSGLNVDDLVPHFTVLPQESGSMEILKEIARARAARRMWAKILKERFGAKNPRTMRMSGLGGANVGSYDRTVQRPLNNLTRIVLGFVASALSGGDPFIGAPPGGFPYDEPLGLGHSLEAIQLNVDADRIIREEAKLRDIIDPFAGSYFMESLTDQVEEEAWKIIEKVDAMGGAIAAIENGYMQREVARSAYERQRKIEAEEEVIVGVNKYIGDNELEVMPPRLVPHPYDPERRVKAEEHQIAKLARMKRERDSREVRATLNRLREVSRDESVNLIPPILEAVKAYATVGEICGVLREVFGEYETRNTLI